MRPNIGACGGIEQLGNLFKVLTIMGEQVSSTLSTPFGFIRVPGRLARTSGRAWFRASRENGLSVSRRFKEL